MKYLISLLIFIYTLNASNNLNYKYTNSLINEDSPYLLQHAHNPIDWYIWEDEALKKAKKEDKLIFLSIGYSTCHWCHVMEKESFENEELAKLFNKYYISIKVDREIRTHLDAHYQDILLALKTRRNGWPLNAILTPDLKVLHITTYIPPEYNFGTEGLDTMLERLYKLYKNDKKELVKILSKNQEAIKNKNNFIKKDDKDLEDQYIKAMEEVYDNGFKGFFKRPRFPLAANLTTLYDIYDLSGDKRAAKMVYEPLTTMAKGGIYDQIEGGFFRYSVHPDWIIPHFEKMLYTTAELVPLYLRAYKDTKDPLYKKIVLESLSEIKRRFSKDDLFYSASNADSHEGKEGEYFVYSYDKIFEIFIKKGFSPEETEKNLEYFDITSIGNFDDFLSNPHFNNNIEGDEKPKKIEQTYKILKELREAREYPFIDKKIITSWNAMMIKAYIKARSLDKKYEEQGIASLEKLLKTNYINGKLYHYGLNGIPKGDPLLEDYAFLIDTLLSAYEIKYNEKYLKIAKKLGNEAIEKFYKNNTWYLNDTILKAANSAHELNFSGKANANFIDRYYTSALSKMFENLITIANYDFNITLLYKVKQMVKNYKDQILSDIPNHPNGLKVLIRLKKGDIILKSKKENLKVSRDKISALKYPFIFTKATKDKEYLACNESTCFAYDLNIDKILNKIKIDIKK